MDLVTDPAVRKLMHTIVSNVLSHPDELSKYGRINLTGKAGAKLCTDPEIAAEHDADPKVLHRTTARWVHESLATHRAVRERASGITLPTLVLYAADDCIADPAATAAFVQREPAVRGEALDQRHEVLNAAEPERSAIIERFGRFLSGLGTDSPNDA